MLLNRNTKVLPQATGAKASDLPPAPQPGMVFVCWLFSLLWLVMTVGSMALANPLVFLFLLLVPLGLLYVLPVAAFVSFLTIVIWQNTAISFWSPYFSSDLLSVLQSISFCVTSSFGLYSFIWYFRSGKQEASPFAASAMKYAGVFLFFALAYMAYGAFTNSFFASAVYFRNFTIGLFSLAIGCFFGRKLGLVSIMHIWSVLGVIVLIQATLEYGFSDYYYDLTNYNAFFAHKIHIAQLDGADLTRKLTRRFFNTPYFDDLGLHSFRMLGPNGHNISFGYLLAFLAITFYITKRYFLVVMSCGFIVVIGAKGATTLVLFALGLDLIYRMGYPRKLQKTTAYAFVLALIAFFFIYGFAVQDFHVLGLIGGLNDFVSNPLGHGFGYGGNFAIDKEMNWQEAQHTGAAPFGLESSVGVLLSQWGGVGMFFLLYLLWLWRGVLQSLTETGRLYLGRYDCTPLYLTLGAIIVNLHFQEEALSPVALGFTMLWFGLLSKYVKMSAREKL